MNPPFQPSTPAGFWSKPPRSAYLIRVTLGHRALLLCLPLLLAACRDEKVSAYRIPKEKDPVAAEPAAAPAAGLPPAGDMAGPAVGKAAGGDLVWTAPPEWPAKAVSAMRKGSYDVKGEGGATADLSITAFPGAVGGEFANVNRWRGQLALPPLAEAELASAVTRFTANDLSFTVVELAGTGADPKRMLGAMVPHNGAMWFFKLMGPDALVAREKPAFLAFLRTVRAAPPAAP